ncbi:MAG: hypothetical protein AABZ15_06500 [Nitrospirota bacterium]
MASGTPILTEKGREAVKTPQVNLTARCRSVLVQIDGKRSLDEVRNSLRGLEGLEEAIKKLTDEGYVNLAQDCRDIIKDAALKILGAKSPTINRKIDELHTRYGDGCWTHLDELDKAARLFYGADVAENLKQEFVRILKKYGK